MTEETMRLLPTITIDDDLKRAIDDWRLVIFDMESEER